MLNDKQILEIREHLEKAQNPLFLYDNDTDGLCSYVILRKFLQRGKGVAVRTHPNLDVGYARRVQQLNADYIFVLDRPHLGEDFVEEIKLLNLPIVWIDHHFVEEDYDYDQIYRYNAASSEDDETAWPVTYWAYKIANAKEALWVAMMGCIADHHFPDFSEEFKEHYNEFWGENITEPFQAYFETEIGKLARSLNFGLKDSITHVVQLQNYLIKCTSPSEMMQGLDSSSAFAKKYRDLSKKYESLIEKAKNSVSDNLLFFVYGGDMSMSSEVSNYLMHLYPKHVVIVAYKTGGICNVSWRGKNVRELFDKVVIKLNNANGGGHKDAVGMRMQAEDLDMFKKEVENLLNEK